MDTELSTKLVMHWGEMGVRWGVNRTVSQIHALLYLSESPLPADEIADRLGVARSNVSNSLRELQNWNLVRIVHVMGDRRDHFSTSHDAWALFRTIISERKAREFDPTAAMLAELSAAPDFGKQSAFVQSRVKDTLELMRTTSKFADDMLSLPSPTLSKLMRLGAKLQHLLVKDKSK
jgi:DNA-binding transcriptional regulator GbsR (MarR family)